MDLFIAVGVPFYFSIILTVYGYIKNDWYETKKTGRRLFFPDKLQQEKMFTKSHSHIIVFMWLFPLHFM